MTGLLPIVFLAFFGFAAGGLMMLNYLDTGNVFRILKGYGKRAFFAGIAMGTMGVLAIIVCINT